MVPRQPSVSSSARQQALVGEAYALAAENRFAEARQRFLDALANGPASGAILRDLAGCSCECGELDHALGYGRAAVALDPGDAKAAIQLGLCLLLAGRYDQGWPLFERRKTLNPLPMPPAPPIPPWQG